MGVFLDELRDCVQLETKEVSPLHVRNSSFEHESADVTHADTEALRNLFDRQQMRCEVGGALFH